VNMDLIVRTPRVPARGENLLAGGFRTDLGGKGANPAVALARMGAESHLIACVGQDHFGERALSILRGEHVHVAGVRAVAEEPTGIALIMVDDGGENTILVVPGANTALTPAAIEAGLAPLWDRLNALMVNFEIPEPCVAAVVMAGRTHGVPVIVDAGPTRRYAPASWAAATVLTPNRLEAETLVGYALEDDAATLRAARELRSLGPESVVLKLGARGALLCTEDSAQFVPAFEVQAVDTTGAGDAFTAALTLALAEGQSLPSAVRFANAAGALAVTRLGALAAMPTRAAVDAFLAARG
jgi:ribokinase